MGYYIEVPNPKGKAKQILELYGGRIMDHRPEFQDVSIDEAIICIVDNGPFEAAAFTFSENELEAFSEPMDRRPKTWLAINWDKACELTGYKGGN